MRYRPEIDGLRTLAVVPVILFHAGVAGLHGGYVGVDVFFVISGFLITSIIIDEVDRGRFTLANFYERRARRILPAMFVMMAVTVPFAWLWMLPPELSRYSASLIATPLYVSNILFWKQAGYFDTAAALKPLLHTWSLGVEEQYYLIYPLLLLAVVRWRRQWLIGLVAAALVVSLGLAEWAAHHKPSTAFYLLPTRWWELAIGSTLALATAQWVGEKGSALRVHGGAQQALSLFGLALIAWSIYEFDDATPVPGFYALIPTVGAALILAFADGGTLVGRALGSRVMAGVGSVSYSAYLWHQPLLAFARLRLLKAPGHPLLWGISVASIGLAVLSARFVEKPFRDRSRTSRRTIVRAAIAASLVFVTLGTVGVLAHGFPSRLPPEARAMLQVEAEHVKLRDDGGCNVKDTADVELAGCIKGAPHTEPSVALWGDSHAAALAVELARALEARGQSFVQVTKNSCPAGVNLANAITDDNRCYDYEERALDYLVHSPIRTVIVGSRWQLYLEDAPFDNGEGGVELEAISSGVRGFVDHHDEARRMRDMEAAFRAGIERLLAAGKHVILIYPDPEQGWNVPEHLARILMFGGTEPSHLSVSQARVHERLRRASEALDAIGERPNLTRVRPEAIFCGTLLPERCAGQIDGMPLYYDDDHYSNQGAKLVVDKVVAAL